jgi:hypothetical protein
MDTSVQICGPFRTLASLPNPLFATMASSGASSVLNNCPRELFNARKNAQKYTNRRNPFDRMLYSHKHRV